MSNVAEPDSTIGWVLYDDSCGFCRQWVPFWASTLRGRGFDIAPLQSEWVGDHLRFREHELLQDLRLLLKNGRQIQGADVYRYVMKRIWWAWPLYLFSIAPFTRRLFDWGYRTFADNRHRFSKACGLQKRG
jgi:predicted DCC family thiol-disulfide oxidoreductase YuxK